MKANKRLNSIYTSNQASTTIEYESGNKEVCTLTEKGKIEYINNLKNWEPIYSDIITEIIKYGRNQGYNKQCFKCNISEILGKIYIKGNGIYMGPMTVTTPIIIPENTILYRYVDSPDHCYANPNGKTYGRLTDPDNPKKQHTFYLSFNKRVAKKEAIHNDVLIKYKTIKKIEAGIIPNRFPNINEETDKFFEQRLRKLCNLIFSLTTKNSKFESVENKSRLNEGIYITTNMLFDTLNPVLDKKVFIYPSTKVNENSELGNIAKDNHFSPNEENANIAIFDDFLSNEDGKPYSNYVKVVKKSLDF